MFGYPRTFGYRKPQPLIVGAAASGLPAGKCLWRVWSVVDDNYYQDIPALSWLNPPGTTRPVGVSGLLAPVQFKSPAENPGLYGGSGKWLTPPKTGTGYPPQHNAWKHNYGRRW